MVVDVGCGSGTFSKALDDGKRLIVALDIQCELLRNVRGYNIERICADAHYLPFRGGSIDCVLSISLMEHLQGPKKHVGELHRVLKDRGKVILQLPNLQYPIEPHSKWPFLFLLPRGFQSKIFEMLNYSYVNMEVTINYALTLFEAWGFKLKERVDVYHLNIMKLLPIAPAYIFILEKRR